MIVNQARTRNPRPDLIGSTRALWTRMHHRPLFPLHLLHGDCAGPGLPANSRCPQGWPMTPSAGSAPNTKPMFVMAVRHGPFNDPASIRPGRQTPAWHPDCSSAARAKDRSRQDKPLRSLASSRPEAGGHAAPLPSAQRIRHGTIRVSADGSPRQMSNALPVHRCRPYIIRPGHQSS